MQHVYCISTDKHQSFICGAFLYKSNTWKSCLENNHRKDNKELGTIYSKACHLVKLYTNLRYAINITVGFKIWSCEMPKDVQYWQRGRITKRKLRWILFLQILVIWNTSDRITLSLRAYYVLSNHWHAFLDHKLICWLWRISFTNQHKSIHLGVVIGRKYMISLPVAVNWTAWKGPLVLHTLMPGLGRKGMRLLVFSDIRESMFSDNSICFPAV